MRENLDELAKALAHFAGVPTHPLDTSGSMRHWPKILEAARSYLALMEGVRELKWCIEHGVSGESERFCFIGSSAECSMVPAKLFIPGGE